MCSETSALGDPKSGDKQYSLRAFHERGIHIKSPSKTRSNAYMVLKLASNSKDFEPLVEAKMGFLR